MPTSFNSSGKPAYMYQLGSDTWYAIGAKVDTAAGYSWVGAHSYLNTVTFQTTLIAKDGYNNFLNPAARDSAIPSPSRGTTCFVRQDAIGTAINQFQFYNGTSWVANDGDINGVTAGSGLTGGGTSGTVTLSIDPTSVYAVPSQSGAGGKYLVSNGTTASWVTLDLDALIIADVMDIY